MLFVVSAAGIVHGIFPFVLKTYVSDKVKKLSEILG